MLNLLADIKDLALQIPQQRMRVAEAIDELHKMELRMLSLANQSLYERDREILEERYEKK